MADARLWRTDGTTAGTGQVSDRGWLAANGAPVAEVSGMARLAPGGPRVHQVKMSASLRVGSLVRAEVDEGARDATRRNHTATHLLHAALRQRLGTHVRQAGSLVAPDRLRFDFSHFRALDPEDRREIVRAVNEHVFANRPVQTEERPTEAAGEPLVATPSVLWATTEDSVPWDSERTLPSSEVSS